MFVDVLRSLHGDMISHSKRCKKKEDSRSLVLTAAALQDHLTKTHHLSLSLGSNIGTSGGVTRKCSNCGGSTYGGSKERPLVPIPTKKGKARNVVDCWLMKGGKDSTHAEKPKFGWEKWERECVLDPKPPPLTLAERLGLVHQPAPLLVEEEWRDIKKKSNQRDDSSQPCPICRDVFGIKQQVILSCSHVFHRSCLQAFERHSGKKCCPLCRQEKYQTRVIYEGARRYRTQAAIRIQACWRGYVVRCWYRRVRQSLPPKDPTLRKKFFERKLSEIAERILGMSSRGERVLDSFLASVDRNIEDSRNVMRSYEQERLAGITEEEWRAIKKKAHELRMSSCAICLGELSWQTATAVASHRSTALLSCSHIFHLSCIESLEQFSLSEHRVCPICRSFYARIEL